MKGVMVEYIEEAGKAYKKILDQGCEKTNMFNSFFLKKLVNRYFT